MSDADLACFVIVSGAMGLYVLLSILEPYWRSAFNQKHTDISELITHITPTRTPFMDKITKDFK